MYEAFWSTNLWFPLTLLVCVAFGTFKTKVEKETVVFATSVYFSSEVPY